MKSTLTLITLASAARNSPKSSQFSATQPAIFDGGELNVSF